jgi:WD40 repeat protein
MIECLGHEDAVTCLAFGPAAAPGTSAEPPAPLLLSGSRDWTARVWDPASGACLGVLAGHAGAVTAVAWAEVGSGGSADTAAGGGLALTGCEDGSAGVWTARGDARRLWRAHTAPVQLVALVADGSGHIVTGGVACCTFT